MKVEIVETCNPEDQDYEPQCEEESKGKRVNLTPELISILETCYEVKPHSRHCT